MHVDGRGQSDLKKERPRSLNLKLTGGKPQYSEILHSAHVRYVLNN